MLNSALPLFVSAHLCFKHRNVFILVEKKEFSRKHFSCVFKKTFNFVRFNTSNTKKTNCHVFRGDSISMGEFNFQIKKIPLHTCTKLFLPSLPFQYQTLKSCKSHSVQTAYFFCTLLSMMSSSSYTVSQKIHKMGTIYGETGTNGHTRIVILASPPLDLVSRNPYRQG